MAKKRSNGEGSIVRMPSGNWRGIIMDGYTKEGKRNMVSFTAPTKGEVQQKIRNYRAARENGMAAQSEDNKFRVWADSWYEDHKTQIQPSTYSGYQYTLKLLKKEFGDSSIDAIRTLDINRFLNKLYENGDSISKISKCRSMLIQIFDAAESNDAVKRNPARLAKVLRNKDVEVNQKDSFTEEEVRQLMDHLPNNKVGHSIRTMLGSGIRVQELLALDEKDIADDGSVIHISKAVKMVDGKAVLGPPKSKNSIRDVPIPGSYRASLMYLKANSGKAFIWCSGRGNMLYGVGTFRKWYYQALKETGNVRLLPPHCCRHTYVSRLEAKGVPMEQIARLVGHSKITTTNGYLHVQEKVLKDAVAVLSKDEKEDDAA